MTAGRPVFHSERMRGTGRQVVLTALAVVSYSLLGAFGTKLLFNWLAGPIWLLLTIVAAPRLVSRTARRG